jgi:hypothetical protein
MTKHISVTTLFLGGMIVLAACSEITGPTDDLQNMRGIITEIRTESLRSDIAIAEILIEEDPSVPLDDWIEAPDKDYSKVLWVVTNETEILRQEEDESLVPIDLEQFHVGSEARAFKVSTFDVYVDTGLPIAYAGRVVLVAPAS